MGILKKLGGIAVTVLGVRFAYAVLDALQWDPMPFLVRRAMTAPNDAWVEVFRWASAFMVAGAIWGAFWLWDRRSKKLQVAVSGIATRSAGYACMTDKQEDDAWVIDFGDHSSFVTISNTSPTESVSLFLRLWINRNHNGKKVRFSIDADLIGAGGRPYTSNDRLEYFKSPVILAPRETARRRLAFLYRNAAHSWPHIVADAKYE
jgi:hypothetical protein